MSEQSKPRTVIEGRTWLVAIGLSLVIMIGFYLRFDSLFVWLDDTDRFFFGEQRTPRMLNVDSYYYLDIAKDIQAGAYQPFDHRRRVPEGHLRAATPRLMSILLASLSRVSSASLEWVAILVPPFLGALLAIPAFLLGRALGARLNSPWILEARQTSAATVMGLTTALFALLSPNLVSRTTIGFYDTDALNVTFAVLAAYLSLRCADAKSTRWRQAWFAGWAVTLLTYLWWWDQSYVAVFALAGLPMLVTLLVLGRRSVRQLLPVLVGLALVVLVVGLWIGFDVLDPRHYWRQLSNLFVYITDEATVSVFPAAGEQVAEQGRVGLARLALESAGGWAPFALAVLGVLALFITARHYALYLTALVVVSGLSFSGTRFLIFTAPLFGLGIGFVAYVIWNRLGPLHWRAGLSLALLLGGAWGAVTKIQSYDRLAPRRPPVLFEAMTELGEKTSADAVIWSNWGHGHPLVYYANKATLGDGIYHPASLQYALDFPLATDDFRLAANWISFVVAHGLEGLRQANELFGDSPEDWENGMPRLQQLLAAGPVHSQQLLTDQAEPDTVENRGLLSFLFPGTRRPIYLFLTYIELSEPWYSIGRWDFNRRTSPENHWYVLLRNLAPLNQTTLGGTSSYGEVLIDYKGGLIKFGDRSFKLKQINIHDGKQLRTANFSGDGKQVVDIIGRARLGVSADLENAQSVLTKLYFELSFDRRYFKPLMIKLPAYSIWKVDGDRYRHDW